MEAEIYVQLRKYLFYLCRIIPVEVFEGLLLLFFVGAIIIFYFSGWKKGWRKVIGLFLAEYVILIYCSTVIFRQVKEGARYNYSPFWSYDAIRDGHDFLIVENIMNVLMFVPVGILLGMIALKTLKSLKEWLIAIGIGLCVSITIEALQFVFRRGLSEFDDVMHNTLGCLIGLMIIAVIEGIWKFCSYLYVLWWGHAQCGRSEVSCKK